MSRLESPVRRALALVSSSCESLGPPPPALGALVYRGAGVMPQWALPRSATSSTASLRDCLIGEESTARFAPQVALRHQLMQHGRGLVAGPQPGDQGL